ncbi:hypothetical protein JTE90_013620 [Oedothorax gibbosus]|uniref:Uncharacterized protein n=1 Tax=Oedothorax gibbosus TaxID=931172 RepID=A0AAV6TH70_9ARAC|nr:hypothetical protein JTE90_013620 [Oedothorax gibbosus]
MNSLNYSEILINLQSLKEVLLAILMRNACWMKEIGLFKRNAYQSRLLKIWRTGNLQNISTSQSACSKGKKRKDRKLLYAMI